MLICTNSIARKLARNSAQITFWFQEIHQSVFPKAIMNYNTSGVSITIDQITFIPPATDTTSTARRRKYLAP